MATPCPPRPSPVEAAHLLSVSVHWPGWDVPHTRFAPHAVPCVWPPSRSVTCSSSLHVAACTVSRLCVAARTASFLRGPALLLGAAAFCSHGRQSVTFGACALVVLNHAAVRVRVRWSRGRRSGSPGCAPGRGLAGCWVALWLPWEELPDRLPGQLRDSSVPVALPWRRARSDPAMAAFASWPPRGAQCARRQLPAALLCVSLT